MKALDTFLFAGLPYAAMALFLAGTIHRYRSRSFQVSSLSSQFLESRALFWGSIPFHFGILVVFLGHLTAFLLPGTVLWWNGQPARLLVLQTTAFAFGLSVLAGLLALMVRRLTRPTLRRVTSPMDLVLEVLLLAQVVLGLWIAGGYRWGSSWFAANLSPYLMSLFTLDPELNAIVSLPWVVRLHIIGAWLIMAIFPFTRLVHILVMPLHYIGRRPQRVIWNWNRRALRDPASPWTHTRPRNN